MGKQTSLIDDITVQAKTHGYTVDGELTFVGSDDENNFYYMDDSGKEFITDIHNQLIEVVK